jgi:hypothetical protein
MSKKTSVSQKACHSRYNNDVRWKTNRIAKLEKHLEKHPEDVIAKAAIKATQTATSPRRSGYKSKHPNRTSGRLVLQLERIIKGAATAEQFVREVKAVVTTAKKDRKPRSNQA